MLWKLSPIVGEIIDKQVSILFELNDKSQTVHFSINDDFKTHVITNKQIGPTQTTLAFKSEGHYTITWFVDHLLAYKHTINISNTITKLVIVSCDRLEADTKHSMWQEIDKIVRKNNTQRVAILHLGDQIYADKVHSKCKKLAKQYKHLNEMNENLLKCYYQWYADRYCQTYRPHSDVLANTSNYYIWDDHEIVNDVVYNINDAVCLAATVAYEDYQQYFHVNKTNLINDYCWYKFLNEDCLMVTIERTSEKLTLQQIKDGVDKLLDAFVVNKLVLSFTSAPIPAPEGIYGHTYTKLKGFGKFWSQSDLSDLLTWLFAKTNSSRDLQMSTCDLQKKKKSLEIVLLGGDIHCGVHGYYQNKDKLIPVVIASPVTNQPAPDRSLIAKAYRNVNVIDINQDFTFHVVNSRAKRCFGVIDFDTMQTDIQFSQESYPKRLLGYF